MYIMKLQPIGKDYIWGGTRLKEEYNKNLPVTPLAETWECSVHNDGPSLITNGLFKGMELRKVLRIHPEYLGIKCKNDSPALIKLIDACDNLSVQVHPNDIYAQKYEHQNGKNEMWYIVDANPDSSLIYGFNRICTKEEIENAIKDGTLLDYLNKVEVKKGDVFYIPAGTVHAIGSGLIIAEIQENSNVTYRVFDYDRVDKNDNKRELHIEKALDVMMTKPAVISEKANPIIENNTVTQHLCECEYFTVIKHQIDGKYTIDADIISYTAILCIEGAGRISNNNVNLEFKKGDCLFIPAGCGECLICGKTEILNVRY